MEDNPEFTVRENKEQNIGCYEESINIEEEIEPKLKYTSLANDVLKILEEHTVSCATVHSKFICIGTHFGWIYMLDHQGNSVRFKDNVTTGFNAHSVSVNMISIDTNGDFIASCSDDGKVLVHGFFTSKYNQTVTTNRSVKCVAIDPHYSKAKAVCRFVSGDERLVLHENKFLSRTRSTVLYDMTLEGGVQNVKWSAGGQHLAWATSICIRVYDINNKYCLGPIKCKKLPNYQNKNGRCNMCWRDSHTLLIGWQDLVRVIRVCRQGSQWQLEEVLSCQIDCVVCGLAPLGDSVAVLGFWQNTSGPQRPQLQVLEPHPQKDLCKDSQYICEYEKYNPTDYFLECLVEESCYLVVSPKDVVVASPYSADQRIEWLLKHFKFEKAMEVATNNSKRLRCHSVLDVGKQYLDHLLLQKQYKQAATLCAQVFGCDKRLWEKEVFRFAEVNQLRTVSPYLPKGNQRLDPHIYEMVLYEFLKMDPEGFLNKVKDWPPTLYNVPAVLNATLDQLSVVSQPGHKTAFLKALALLYTHEKKYDKVIQMYIRLKFNGVFELITKYKLYFEIYDNLEELMKLNLDQSLTVLLERHGDGKELSVPTDIVVSRLSSNKYLLYMYLDALDQRTELRFAGPYHGMLVSLYADFAPDKLLYLLRRSDRYPILEALNICKDHSFYPGIVYLLDKIGNTKEALQLIIEQIGDIEQAISFCKEHDDPELWEYLINCSLMRPDYIKLLLQRIGTYVDPVLLLRRIANSMIIPNLIHDLIKLMRDYNLEVSIQEGIKEIFTSDFFKLQHQLVRRNQRATSVDYECFCQECHKQIICNDVTSSNSIVIFYCKHLFHEGCLPPLQVTLSCVICNSQKNNQSSICNTAGK